MYLRPLGKNIKISILHVILVIKFLNTWYAVNKLQGGPQPVELRALVNVDDAVSRGFAVPDRVLEESLDPVEDDLEDAEAAAEPLSGQQVSLAGDLRLLGRAQLLNVGDHLQSRVSREQTF